MRPLTKIIENQLIIILANSNQCNKIPGRVLSKNIANDNSKNHCRINLQNDTNSLNNSRTIRYIVSRNDKNNENGLEESY